jgi:TolB protein
MTLRPLSLPLALLLTAAPVFAQETAPAAPTPPAVTQTTPRETIEGQLSQERTIIALPAFATPAVATVAGLRTDNLGRQIAEVIAADLERSGLYAPLGPGSVRAITMPEVTAPRFADWKARNAENVVQGFVRTRAPGGLMVG